MFEFKGKEIKLDQNQGPYGAWLYEKEFGTSLTADAFTLFGGVDGQIKPDSIALLKLVFIMGGFVGKYTWVDFLKNIPVDYNVLDDFEEIVSMAEKTYWPSKRATEKESSKKEKE